MSRRAPGLRKPCAWTLFLAWAATSSACADSASAPAATRHAALIYGADDRQELSQLRDDDALRSAARAVAAVIPRARISMASDGRPELSAPTLAHAEQLCAGEPFADQPSAAECTAVLIDDRLVATAGHCFANAWDCQNYQFVFDYAYHDDRGTLQLEAGDLYECSRAYVQENDALDAAVLRDFAIVELTRPVQGRSPVSLRTSAPEVAEPLAVVSTTAGVPLKVDRGARVLQTRSDFFFLDADTFHGSSGAPVFDGTASLLGVLARGNQDYRWDAEADCYVEQERAAPALASSDAAVPAQPPTSFAEVAEQASLLEPAVAALCARGYPSTRLCGTALASTQPCPWGGGLPPCPERPPLDDVTTSAVPAAAPAMQQTSAAEQTPAPPMSPPAELEDPEVVLAASSERHDAGCSASGPATATPGWGWLVVAVLGQALRTLRWQGRAAAAGKSAAHGRARGRARSDG